MSFKYQIGLLRVAHGVAFKKYLYNTLKNKIRFVCLKVKFSTFNPSLR
jgi:hypothetical protein